MLYDGIIIGGGPGGLACAIQMARSRRHPLLFDRGNPRLSYIPTLSNYLGFPDGIGGKELLELSRRQAQAFGVPIRHEEVVRVAQEGDGPFTVEAPSGTYSARRLILATGIMDRHPEISNKFEYAGKSIFYCLDCDGYEFIGKKAVLFGHSQGAFLSALRLSRLARSLWIALNGQEPQWDSKASTALSRLGIPVIPQKIDRILGSSGQMSALAFSDGTTREAEIGLSAYGAQIHNDLARQLDLEILPNGHVIVNRDMGTSRRGVYAVGDLINNSQQVSVAAAAGIRAAIMIEKSFFQEEFGEYLK